MNYDSGVGQREGNFDAATVVGARDERKEASFEVGGVPVCHCAFEHEPALR